MAVLQRPANEPVLGVADLVTSVSDREQVALNVKGINIIRHRPGAGIRIWGARTVAADALWNYVNVRRLFLFVERSVRDSVNWAVFQPNNNQTRENLKNSIAAFLFRCYNEGMLTVIHGKTLSQYNVIKRTTLKQTFVLDCSL